MEKRDNATLVGLTESREASLSLDAPVRVSNELTAYGYLAHERYRSEQAGSQSTTVADWFVDNDDRANSLGVGFTWQKDARLEFGGDYVYSNSNGATGFSSAVAAPPVNAFPDLETNMHSLRLYANYQWRKQTRVKLVYRYERYQTDDWSIDGVNVDTIPEVLLLGEENPGYDQHLVGLYLATEF